MNNKYPHLTLPLFQGNINRRKKKGGGGGYTAPDNRNKLIFSQQLSSKAEELEESFSELKIQLDGILDPSLIFEIEINQSVFVSGFRQELESMGINVLSVAENKRGYWIVFSENDNLTEFKRKLNIHGAETGAKYDFFHAIESFQDIPAEKKIGHRLSEQPLQDSADFVDLELWKMRDPQKNEEFIQKLRAQYSDLQQFRITDTLITNSFVLHRVKLTKAILDDIIQLKEVARVDRPSLTQFDPFELVQPDVQDMIFSSPHEDAMGILIIDSGIVSNHPMLEKCVGGEENFQSVESEIQDTVGHGTSVAGCAAYGDITDALQRGEFVPQNWLFSAKVMYGKDGFHGRQAVYDPERLFENQLKDAVQGFLPNPEYRIKVVNISLGNSNEIWHTHYSRQLPLAALIDELAYAFPDVVFIVSAGNCSPLGSYESVAEIIDNYPSYLVNNSDFKIINPATSALALTVGSIADANDAQIQEERHGPEQIKTPVAQANQPSPFTRVGLGINGMIKPELVEYGGNLILSENYGRIVEDNGGKLVLLNNQTVSDIMRFDVGTSFSAPKVAHLAGKIANQFPHKSANFIKNMLLVGADYPFSPTKNFYQTKDKKDAEKAHLSVCGYGLSSYERAMNSFDNRVVLWDEGSLGLNQIKIYSLQMPSIFFEENGKKKIIVTLTFTPETRSTRGDSYLGNRMEFHLFHTVPPQRIIEKYGVIDATGEIDVPADLEKCEIKLPGANSRKAGCHQKAWKTYHRQPKFVPKPPLSLVLLNINKWVTEETRMQDYCISVTFEHEKDIQLYNAMRMNVQARTRIK